MSKDIPEGLARHLQNGRAQRTLQIERAAIDVEARTVTLAFASETPVERWGSIEILEVSPKAMRQDRLRRGLNILLDHNWTDVVGVTKSVEIGADRIARAVTRFGRSARAEEAWQDVVDEIRINVSVGYIVHKAQLVETKDGVETYRVTDWEPIEISLVSVPADINVGVGRSAADPAPNPEPPKETKMTEPVATTQPAAPAAPAQRNHAAEISALAATVPGAQDLALRAIQAQQTVEQFQQDLIRHLATKPVPTAELGMEKKEVQRYSLMRMINARANLGDYDAQRAAAFEIECANEMTKKMGRQARGFYVPYDVLVSKRDLTVGNAASAGNLVANELLTGSFIELLRARMVIGSLGVQYLTGLVGDIDIPRQTGTATTYWVAEQGAPTKSNQIIDKVNMSPKTVGAKTVISRKLRQQSSLDVEAMVQRDLATALALEMERAVINGSGASNQPRGVLNVSGIGNITAGGPLTWQTIVDLETHVAVANADMGSRAYLTNARVRGALKSTSKVSGQNGFIWENGSTPVNGYNTAVTDLVPSNLGGGTDSAIIFGNFNDLIIGMWGGLDVLIDQYTGGDQGDISIRVLQDMDVAVRHPESFAAAKDVATA